MSDDALTAVKTYNSEIDANLAKTVLESEGIFSSVFKDDLGGMRPDLSLTLGVRLMVRKADLERAKQILDASE